MNKLNQSQTLDMLLEAMYKGSDQTKLMSMGDMQPAIKGYGSSFNSQSVQGVSTKRSPINSLEGFHLTSEEAKAANLLINAMNKQKRS